MSDNDFVRPEDLIQKGRLEVGLPGGGKVLIRKLRRVELAYMIEALPDVTAYADKEPEHVKLSMQQIERAEDAIYRVIIGSVLTPKFHSNPDAGPTPADLNYEDQMTLFHAILEHSGFSKAKMEAALPLSKTES